MGQRLNIEINQNGETLANAYYHWSAYTSSSLELTRIILENKNKVKHEDPVIYAVRLLETTGARLQEDEIKPMQKRNPLEKFEIATDRNEGLIAISEKGKDETRKWEEGRVEIYLDDETINFDVVYTVDKEEFMEDYEKTEEEYKEMPIKNYQFVETPFDVFTKQATDLLEEIRKGIYAIRLEDGDVLSFVE